MLNHTKSLILNEIYSSPNLDEIVIQLYTESCVYIYSRIHSETAKARFLDTSNIVLSSIKTHFSYSNYASFGTTHKALVRLKNNITNQYTFRNILEVILFNPEKYDDMAFDIAFDILNKIRIRFFDGYVG